MKIRIKKIMTGVILLLLIKTSVSSGDSFRIIGPRPLALGGAFTAKVDDPSALYWNPAALAFNKGERGLGIMGGIGYRTYGNLIKKLDNIINIVKKGSQDMYSISQDPKALINYDISNITDFIAGVENFDNKTGVSFDPSAGLFFSIYRFGVGFVGYGDIGSGPMIDLDRIALKDSSGTGGLQYVQALAGDGSSSGVDPSTFFPNYSQLRDNIIKISADWESPNILGGGNNLMVDDYLARMATSYGQKGYARADKDIEDAVLTLAGAPYKTDPLSQNQTGARIRGFAAGEIPFGAGVMLGDFFSIGGAFKIIEGWAIDRVLRVVDLKKGEDILEWLKINGTPSTTWGVDLGFLARLPFVTIGIVGKDLNGPKLSTGKSGLSKIKIEQKLRAGINVHLMKLLSFSIDADLLPTHETFNTSLKSQEISLGAEVNLKFLQLRTGYRRNLREKKPGNIYSAGLGLSLFFLKFDLAVVLSDFSGFMSKRLPNETRVEGGLSLYF